MGTIGRPALVQCSAIPRVTGDNGKEAMTNNKQTLAYHEAGHVIASVQLGIGVLRATIDPQHPHFLRDRFTRRADTALEHLCLIALAGPAAEELFVGPITDHGDFLDLSMVKSYLEQGYPQFQRGYQLARLESAAENLVSTDWARARIKRLADALMKQTSLDADEIYSLTAARITPAAPEEYGFVHIIGGQR